jgi:NtrC-family two-component system sensor histidine kinase KinB
LKETTYGTIEKGEKGLSGGTVRMTLKKKILLGYGVAFALMGLVVAWAVVNLVSLGKASHAILQENYRSILAAENMLDSLDQQDSGLLLMFLGNTEQGTTRFRDKEALFFQWLVRAKDNITIQGEAEIVHSIETDYAKYRSQVFNITDLPNPERTPQNFLRKYQDSVYPLFMQVRETCIRLRNLNEETMYAASVRAGQVANRAIWSTAFVAGSAMMVALIFSLLLSERIARPLRRFMEASRKIADGDYTIHVPVETGDELGHLAKEFNQMASQLARYHEMNIEQIISEKQKGEAILASIDDGVVVLDNDLKMTGINPAARHMLGLAFEENKTWSCSDILREPRICDFVKKTIETGVQPKVNEEDRIFTLVLGESPRHYLFSVTAIRGKEQSPSGVVLLLRDVTRLKEVERLKNEFVMAASHELRTPLTSMGMSIDLLLERAVGSLDKKDQELLEAAHEELTRLKALVNDLLDLSKIEAGRIDLEFQKVSVPALVQHVKAVFSGQMEKKSVELSTQLAEDLPEIRADANKITWVLINLVSNALRYVKENGCIQVLGKRVGAQVHLSVRDDGPGIPSEYHTKIFDKFVQVKGQEAGGTGLGLAICKEIVRAHGGTIWVESSPGEGSTFTFTVPVAG